MFGREKTMSKLAYIFDIDGTIADNSHRQHYVRNKPKNWRAFNVAMADDKPIKPVIDLLHCIMSTGKYKILFSSGRQECDREVTTEWLYQHAALYAHDYELFMRKTDDFRDDTIVKKEMLDKIKELGYTPVAVFDDRTRVVDLWRSEGLYVFDCNQTRENF